MDNIIKGLFEIEEEAHKISGVSKTKINDIKRKAKKNTEENLKKIQTKKEIEISEIKKEAEQNIEAQLSKIKMQLEEEMFRYETAFNKKQKSLAEEIFNNIIKD